MLLQPNAPDFEEQRRKRKKAEEKKKDKSLQRRHAIPHQEAVKQRKGTKRGTEKQGQAVILRVCTLHLSQY